MDGSERYLLGFDKLMRHVESLPFEMLHDDEKIREVIWRKIGKAFNSMFDTHGWTEGQKQAEKKRILEQLMGHVRTMRK